MARAAASILAEIDRQIAWYEERGHEMKTQEYQLAFAVVIGATTALRDIRATIAPTAPPFRRGGSAGL